MWRPSEHDRVGRFSRRVSLDVIEWIMSLAMPACGPLQEDGLTEHRYGEVK